MSLARPAAALVVARLSNAVAALSVARRNNVFGGVGARGSRVAQMLVIDCLFVGVAQQSYDSSIAALRKTYLAVQDRKVPQGGRP